MDILQQTWDDLIQTPVLSKIKQTKYIDNEWLNELICLVVTGDYETFFVNNPDLQDLTSKNIDDPQWIEISHKLNDNQELINLLRILIGISFLQLFIINNFTGPKSQVLKTETVDRQANATEFLIRDGEVPVSTGERYIFLVRAIEIFNVDRLDNQQHWIYSWWTMRTLITHQKMLEELSATLCSQSQLCIDHLLLHESSMNKTQQLLLSIEQCHVLQYYFNWKQADQAKARAIDLSDLNVNLTGHLGRRTRYQVKTTSQLLVDIERKNQSDVQIRENFDMLQDRILPKDLSLTDDVVLNQIQFENGSEYQDLTIQLTSIEQLTLLMIINDRQVNNPKHEITVEEQLAFLTYILARPINWSIQTCSLVLRCKNETENKRKIERTLLQLQELIDQFDSASPSSSFRLEYFHSTVFCPMWKLKTQVAHIYLKLGLVNNALDLYLFLKKWTDVIHCYQLLKKLSLAEYVIREQLKIQETPDLLCSLGEVTNEFEHFQRAWELSKERSGRAQRLMGKHYFNRGNYEKACEHLIKAVEINSLQHDLWFWLGSAAFRTEKWELGIRAYSRCTNIEPDNFEAWNNLAACHTKLKQIDKAHKVFLEAIKCNYDNWKVWENFLWTSADCGEIDDVIQAYHRLIDLKTKYVDKPVLNRLVHLLNESNRDELWKKIHQHSLELFGRLTGQVTNDADIWELYSDLCQLKNDDTTIEWHTKILQQLQRAHRCAISQASAWDSEISTMTHVVHLSNKLAQNAIETLAQHNTNENFKSLCQSIRLSLNTVMTRLKQKYDVSSMTEDQTLNENIHLLEKSLVQLTDALLNN